MAVEKETRGKGTGKRLTKGKRHNKETAGRTNRRVAEINVCVFDVMGGRGQGYGNCKTVLLVIY